MTDPVVLERSFLGYPLSVRAYPAGGDLVILITGGCRPHVGSVSCAFWEGGAVRCETSVGHGHHDDVVSSRFAQKLAQTFQCAVSVSCGIHYDGLSRESISRVLTEMDSLLDQLTDRIRA